ncbi:hypothetical protein GCM10028827_06940 [Mucilaginibacter myungsuensis]
MNEYVIEFDSWECAEKFEVHLEPEGTPFYANFGTKLRFVATCDRPFTWTARLSKGEIIQLYPVHDGDADISVYEDGILIY